MKRETTCEHMWYQQEHQASSRLGKSWRGGDVEENRSISFEGGVSVESVVYVIDTAVLECTYLGFDKTRVDLIKLSVVLLHEALSLRDVILDPELVEVVDDQDTDKIAQQVLFLRGLWQMLIEEFPAFNEVFTAWRLFEVDFMSVWLTEEENPLFPIESLILANGVLESVRRLSKK